METEIIQSLIQIFGIGGVLMMAVKYLAQKLSEQYERRIDALEDASKRCEEDRVSLRNQMTALLLDLLELKKKLT
jgi:hypothetical protein